MNNLIDSELQYVEAYKKRFNEINIELVKKYYFKMLDVENEKNSIYFLSNALLFASLNSDIGKLNFDMFEIYFWNLQKLNFHELFSELFKCKKYGFGDTTNQNIIFLEKFDSVYNFFKKPNLKIIFRCFVEKEIKEKFNNDYFDCKDLDFVNFIIDKILNLKQENPENDISELMQEIEEIIYKLYDLKDEHIALLKEKN